MCVQLVRREVDFIAWTCEHEQRVVFSSSLVVEAVAVCSIDGCLFYSRAMAVCSIAELWLFVL